MTITIRTAKAAVLTFVSLLMMALTVPAQASDALQAEGKAAVEVWIEAVASGDAEKVAAVSAPEFQIVRGDGSAHDLQGYLRDLPVLQSVPAMENVVVTGSADQLVVRYTVDAIKDVGGKSVDAFGPRLTVLRKDGDTWLVVAHSNFSTIAQDPEARE